MIDSRTSVCLHCFTSFGNWGTVSWLKIVTIFLTSFLITHLIFNRRIYFLIILGRYVFFIGYKICCRGQGKVLHLISNCVLKMFRLNKNITRHESNVRPRSARKFFYSKVWDIIFTANRYDHTPQLDIQSVSETPNWIAMTEHLANLKFVPHDSGRDLSYVQHEISRQLDLEILKEWIIHREIKRTLEFRSTDRRVLQSFIFDRW